MSGVWFLVPFYMENYLRKRGQEQEEEMLHFIKQWMNKSYKMFATWLKLPMNTNDIGNKYW